MPGAWAQLGFYSSVLPTNPTIEGTLVFSSTRCQGYYLHVYETDRPTHSMMCTDDAFSTLIDLGTIMGDEVGRAKFAGYVPMAPSDI